MITLACVAAINESVETLDVECGGAAAQAVGSLHQIGGSGGVGISDTVGRHFRFDLCTVPVPLPTSVLPWARAR
jgi:hypothetical protein